jgi:hypothetical protein
VEGLGTFTGSAFKVRLGDTLRLCLQQKPSPDAQSPLGAVSDLASGSRALRGESRRPESTAVCWALNLVFDFTQVANNAGIRYKYYFSSPVTAIITVNAVTLTSAFTGVMRIVVLRSSVQPILSYDAATAAAVEQLYDSYAGAARARVLGLSWAVLYMLCCPDRLHCVMICGG